MKVICGVYIFLVCFILLVKPAQAQTNPPATSDVLREKINEIESIDAAALSTSVQTSHKRSLLVLYDKYVTALRRDIDALKRIQATMGAEADPQGQEKLEKLIDDEKAATEKLKALRGEPSQAAEVSTHIPRSCDQFFKGRESDIPVGAIWCGTDPNLSAEGLAELSAPILWFSPDEPLRKSGKLIPENLPGHEFKGPVVYYRISKVVIAPGDDKTKVTSKTETLDLTKIRGLTLRYYFYYSQDVGFVAHAHDLESIRLYIHVTDKDASGRQIRTPSSEKGYLLYISQVVGAAHGVTWYYNQLDRKSGTSLPITILVEEGKHASSPDRNADGHYSPGYDVNRRFNDAWGVRDLIGSGELGNVGYDGSMTKPRNPADMLRVDPQLIDVESLLRPYTGPHKDTLMSPDQKTYKLARVNPEISTLLKDENREEFAQATEVRKTQVKNPEEAARLAIEDVNKIKNFMKSEHFDEEDSKVSHGENFIQKGIKKGLGIERGEEVLDALTLTYRYDAGHGFSILPPIGRYRFAAFGGYFVPKFNWVRSQEGTRFSLESLYTPSAARRVDWYGAIGSEWSRREETGDYKPRFVSEGGLKFRFNLNKFLIGARIGLRATGLKQPQNPRLIFEFGPGAF